MERYFRRYRKKLFDANQYRIDTRLDTKALIMNQQQNILISTSANLKDNIKCGLIICHIGIIQQNLILPYRYTDWTDMPPIFLTVTCVVQANSFYLMSDLSFRYDPVNSCL